MDELQQSYLEGLSSRLAGLGAARARLAAGDAAALESIRRIAHALRGSGGTYGFPQISTAAAAIEDAAPELLDARLDILIREIESIQTGEGTRPAPILVIEDDQEVADILSRTLETARHEVILARTGAEAQACLASRSFALVVLDLVLPDTDGRSLLASLRRDPRSCELPVMVLSAIEDEAVKAECFALGAEAYVEKPFSPDTLAAVVSSHLQHSAHLSAVARSDSLTGASSRPAFSELYRKLLALASRHHLPSSVAIVDVDHLSVINREHGVAVGDMILRELAAHLARSGEEHDAICRWGGEEFVVLMPGAPEAEAKIQLERALASLKERPMVVPDRDSLPFSFSAGVVEIHGDMPLEKAVAKADWFLFYAKTGGRSLVVGSQDQRHPPTMRTVLLAEDDPATATLVTKLLEDQHLRVVHCEDGEAAFTSSHHGEFALAILDVKMPGMDGFELLTRLRHHSTFRDLPIMMLTSLGKEEDVVQGFELGADDYVLKPFSPEELIARVRRLLRRSADR